MLVHRPHQRAGVLFLYSCVMGYRRLETRPGEHKIKGAILAGQYHRYTFYDRENTH
jgi:hypothetical protein